jgi:hypothetical protein
LTAGSLGTEAVGIEHIDRVARVAKPIVGQLLIAPPEPLRSRVSIAFNKVGEALEQPIRPVLAVEPRQLATPVRLPYRHVEITHEVTEGYPRAITARSCGPMA